MFTKKSILFLSVCFAMASCSKESSWSIDNLNSDNSEVETVPLLSPTTHCETNIIDAESGNLTTGTASLRRTDSKISMSFKADGLIPGNTYTLWWVIWNKPEKCLSPYACDVSDYNFAELVEVDAFYASSIVVGSCGKGNFSGSLEENDSSYSINGFFKLPKHGLYNAKTAEIHLVLRNDGPLIDAQEDEPISFYPGDCLSGDCDDPLFAVFSSDCGIWFERDSKSLEINEY